MGARLSKYPSQSLCMALFPHANNGPSPRSLAVMLLRMFSSMHISGEQLGQLSGVAAILRFPVIDEDEAEGGAAVEPEVAQH